MELVTTSVKLPKRKQLFHKIQLTDQANSLNEAISRPGLTTVSTLP